MSKKLKNLTMQVEKERRLKCEESKVMMNRKNCEVLTILEADI